MRWLWIDRFLEFERGKRAVAIKAVALAEEQIDNYVPGFPMMPQSLIVEGMAQTGGLLAGEAKAFKERVVLAKIGKVIFHGVAMVGDVLRYTAVIEDLKPDGVIISATSHIGDQLQAEVEMVLAHLDDDRFSGVKLFDPADFLQVMRVYGLWEVARDSDGNRLSPPDYMIEAEDAFNAGGPPGVS